MNLYELDNSKSPRKKIAEISDKAMHDYRRQAHYDIQGHKFGSKKDAPNAAAIIAKREKGMDVAGNKITARRDAQIAQRKEAENQRLRDKYAGVDIDAEIAKLKPALERAYHEYQYGARNTWSQGRDDYQSLSGKMNELQRAKAALEQGVAEGEEMATFSALKDWQVWDVHVYNNFYRGKYADYGPRLYSVVASSPEEARQVVINNPDYVLQDLLSRKLQNGKKVLPHSSALPIEDKRVGKAQPGTITTMGLKKMLSPDGVQSFKFTNGKIVDGAHMDGGEEVDEGLGGDMAKLIGIPVVAGAAAIGAQHYDDQQPHVQVGGQNAKIVQYGSSRIPDSAMLLKGQDGKMYRVWQQSGKGMNKITLASPAEPVKEGLNKTPLAQATVTALQAVLKTHPEWVEQYGAREVKRVTKYVTRGFWEAMNQDDVKGIVQNVGWELIASAEENLDEQGVAEGRNNNGVEVSNIEPGDTITWWYNRAHPDYEGVVREVRGSTLIVYAPGSGDMYQLTKDDIRSHKKGVAEGAFDKYSPIAQQQIAKDREQALHNTGAMEVIHDLINGSLDGYDVMNHPRTPAQKVVAKMMQDKYDDISIDQRLHGDDDFEEIISRIIDNFEADYGRQENLSELSNELLGAYKKAAGISARDLDKAGKYKQADKRFHGIVQATKKEFDNDLKKHPKTDDVTESRLASMKKAGYDIK